MRRFLCKIDQGGGMTIELALICNDNAFVSSTILESCDNWLCDGVIDYDSIVEIYENGDHVYNVVYDIDYNGFIILKAE